MKLHTMRRTGALAAAALTLTVGLGACSSEDSSSTDTGTDSSSEMSESPSEEMTPSDDMSASEDTGMADPAANTYGPACDQVPADGAASFSGMAAEPVATAASANPLLKTLVKAVGEAGLVDPLNSAPELTVFAPVDDAFAAIPKKQLDGVLADKALLAKVLSHHVVAQRVEPDQLGGEYDTLAGDKLMINGEGEEATIGTEKATVLCGGVQTANATVYLIDTVMMPAM